LVASLARPGGNVTGLSVQSPDLVGKRIELLREVVPGLQRLAAMASVGSSAAMLAMGEVQAVARPLGLSCPGNGTVPKSSFQGTVSDHAVRTPQPSTRASFSRAKL
jgi:ABC-type uncharacterized transport system substrate-binding protein